MDDVLFVWTAVSNMLGARMRTALSQWLVSIDTASCLRTLLVQCFKTGERRSFGGRCWKWGDGELWIPTYEVSRSAVLRSRAEKVALGNLWPIVLCVWSLILCLIKHVLTVWPPTSTSACLVTKQCLMMFGCQTFPVWTGLKPLKGFNMNRSRGVCACCGTLLCYSPEHTPPASYVAHDIAASSAEHQARSSQHIGRFGLDSQTCWWTPCAYQGDSASQNSPYNDLEIQKGKWISVWADTTVSK